MRSTRSRAATKCISEVPGLLKQTSTPPATSVRTRLSAPFIIALPIPPDHGRSIIVRAGSQRQRPALLPWPAGWFEVPAHALRVSGLRYFRRCELGHSAPRKCPPHTAVAFEPRPLFGFFLPHSWFFWGVFI